MTVARRGVAIQVTILLLVALGFLGAGGHLLLAQRTGEKVSVAVTSCDVRRRSEVCHGTWELRGERRAGLVTDATTEDVGTTVTARAHGDHASVPNPRVPLVLVCVGLFWLVMLAAVTGQRRRASS